MTVSSQIEPLHTRVSVIFGWYIGLLPPHFFPQNTIRAQLHPTVFRPNRAAFSQPHPNRYPVGNVPPGWDAVGRMQKSQEITKILTIKIAGHQNCLQELFFPQNLPRQSRITINQNQSIEASAGAQEITK